jgi:hypothetical protein
LGPSKGDEQYHLYRREDDPVLRDRDEEWRRSQSPRQTKRPAPTNGTGHHHGNGKAEPLNLQATAEHYARQLTTELQAELAAALGLPQYILASIPLLGFREDDPHGPCWAIPEHDAAGRVVGISRRYRDGSKKAFPGGGRGLVVPERWREREGPVFLPEGASDVLALTAMGMCAVGRPSNLGGVEQLAELLKDLPADRDLVLVAEWDPKPDGRWPGLDGAVKVAGELAERLGRTVFWVLPPPGAKDARAWVAQQKLDPACADAWQDAGERLLQALRGKYQQAKPAEAAPSFRWQPIDSATFARADYRPRWLIKRVLVAGQPALVGGARKMLKTSIEIDMAVSLASGTPFLGEFPVARPVRVAVLSGESGEYTLQETARRVCQARGIRLEDVRDNLVWQFDLPQLANPEHLAELQGGLRRDGIEALVFDPLYLALLAGQGPNGAPAENLFDMGPLLLGITRACLSAGTTPALIHHARKGAAASKDPIELDDLAYAGVAEFARQWVLISRREKFQPGTGLHKLWLSVGGSTGHGGLWAVDVDEGVLAEDFTGRKWEVSVSTATDAREAERESQRQARRQKDVEQDNDDDAALAAALDRLDPRGEGCSWNKVQTEARLSDARMGRAVSRLKERGAVEETVVVVDIGSKTKRTAKGLRRPLDEE